MELEYHIQVLKNMRRGQIHRFINTRLNHMADGMVVREIQNLFDTLESLRLLWLHLALQQPAMSQASSGGVLMQTMKNLGEFLLPVVPNSFLRCEHTVGEITIYKINWDAEDIWHCDSGALNVRVKQWLQLFDVINEGLDSIPFVVPSSSRVVFQTKTQHLPRNLDALLSDLPRDDSLLWVPSGNADMVVCGHIRNMTQNETDAVQLFVRRFQLSCEMLYYNHGIDVYRDAISPCEPVHVDFDPWIVLPRQAQVMQLCALHKPLELLEDAFQCFRLSLQSAMQSLSLTTTEKLNSWYVNAMLVADL